MVGIKEGKPEIHRMLIFNQVKCENVAVRPQAMNKLFKAL